MYPFRSDTKGTLVLSAAIFRVNAASPKIKLGLCSSIALICDPNTHSIALRFSHEKSKLDAAEVISSELKLQASKVSKPELLMNLSYLEECAKDISN